MKGHSVRLIAVTIILLLAAACAANTPAPSAVAPTPIPPSLEPPTPAPLLPTAAPPMPTSPPTASPVVTGAGEEEKLVRAYVDAANSGDFPAALALLVDGGLSFMYAGFTARDKSIVQRDALEQEAGMGTTWEVIGCAPKGTGAVCDLVQRNAHCLKAQCGLDAYRTDVTVKLKDGKIQLMSFSQSPSTDDQSCDEAYPKFLEWVEANRADEWKKLRAAAAYDLAGRSFGEALSAVCKAYLDNQK